MTPSPTPWPARDAEHLLVSGAQMAAVETRLFESGLPVEALMEKAGLALSQRLLEAHGPRLRACGALVLVGPGHNGGDGLVVARELHLAGIAVQLWCPFERCKPLTATHRRHAHWLGIPTLADPPDPAAASLWIEALLGLNQSRPPGAALETLLEHRQQQAPGGLVALDVPTGLCSDTGRCLGAVAAKAIHTCTVGLIKQGLVQDGALAWVGRLERVDLGLARQALDALPASPPLLLAAADLSTAPWPRIETTAGKYGRGRLLLLAGSARFQGAAHLAVAGASASGCASVRLAGAAGVGGQLVARAPHVVVSAELACDPAGHLCLADLPATTLERLDALLLGPGLGGQPQPALGAGRELEVWERLQRLPGLLVLDADGLNRLALAVAPGLGCSAAAWLGHRQGPTWLTPHGAEFERLFPQWAELPPLEAAGRAAGEAGVGLVLKGARSVVAAPDGRRWQLGEAEPRAARAGLGDVLAGYCAGLGAQAIAACGQADAAVLAAAALAHAQAGLRVRAGAGPGHCTPMAIASALAGLDPAPGGQGERSWAAAET